MESHLADLDARLGAANRLRTALIRLLAPTRTRHEATDDLLEALNEMTTLDREIEQGVQILVNADLEAAPHHLVEVFDLGPGTREYSAQDPEGGLWSFMRRLPEAAE